MSGRDRDGTEVEETEASCPFCDSKDLKVRRRDAIYLGKKGKGGTVCGWKVVAQCQTCGREIETRTSYHNKS